MKKREGRGKGGDGRRSLMYYLKSISSTNKAVDVCAPLTRSGTILVNNVPISCFAYADQWWYASLPPLSSLLSPLSSLLSPLSSPLPPSSSPLLTNKQGQEWHTSPSLTWGCGRGTPLATLLTCEPSTVISLNPFDHGCL